MDGGYTFPKSLVNALIGSIFLSLMGIAGYMVSWNASDQVAKQYMTSALKHQTERMTALEYRLSNHPHGSQILPEAKLRLDQLEAWRANHMRDHRDNP